MHIVYKDIALLEVKEDQNGVGWSIANGGGIEDLERRYD